MKRLLVYLGIPGLIVSMSLPVLLASNPLVYNGTNTNIHVRGTDDQIDFVNAHIPTLPGGTEVAAQEINAQATAKINYSNEGFFASEVELKLGAAAEKSSFGQLAGQVWFTPQMDMDWTLSGELQWAGNWANGVGMFAQIKEMSTDKIITLHFYDSAGVLSNVNYKIGAGGGNVSNKIGSVKGVLMAGVQYEFYYVLSTDNNQFSPQTGKTQGNVGLKLTPKPCPYALLGDLNNDCIVDLCDFALMAANWMTNCWLDNTNPECVQ